MRNMSLLLGMMIGFPVLMLIASRVTPWLIDGRLIEGLRTRLVISEVSSLASPKPLHRQPCAVVVGTVILSAMATAVTSVFTLRPALWAGALVVIVGAFMLSRAIEPSFEAEFADLDLEFRRLLDQMTD